MPIDYKPFIHPEDREAMANLEAIPLLDTVVKKHMESFTEDMMQGINLASFVRIGPRQMPDLHSILLEVCEELKITVPDFFLEMDPNPNAYTYGYTKPFVVVNSGIIDLLDRTQLKSVIAHECGHILCQHVLYHTLAASLVDAGGLLGSVFGLGIVSKPLKWALMYWVRRSEFSADRVAAYVMKDASVVARTMMHIAGGASKTVGEINLDLFLEQAEEYEKYISQSQKSKILQKWEARSHSHPYPALRAAEVLKWYRVFRPASTINLGNDTLNW